MMAKYQLNNGVVKEAHERVFTAMELEKILWIMQQRHGNPVCQSTRP